jgi:hypothetical protein
MLVLLPALFCAGSALVLKNKVAVRVGSYSIAAYPDFDSIVAFSADGSQGFGVGAPCPTAKYMKAWEAEVANTGIVLWRCMDVSELVAPAYVPPASSRPQTR